MPSARSGVTHGTPARPRLRTSRPLGVIVPLRSVETDPDGEPCLCAVHHGAVVASLTERIAAEGAALEAHLAARARALVDFELVELPRLHGIAPAARPPAPTGAPEAPAAVEAAPADAPG